MGPAVTLLLVLVMMNLVFHVLQGHTLMILDYLVVQPVHLVIFVFHDATVVLAMEFVLPDHLLMLALVWIPHVLFVPLELSISLPLLGQSPLACLVLLVRSACQVALRLVALDCALPAVIRRQEVLLALSVLRVHIV